MYYLMITLVVLTLNKRTPITKGHNVGTRNVFQFLLAHCRLTELAMSSCGSGFVELHLQVIKLQCSMLAAYLTSL